MSRYENVSGLLDSIQEFVENDELIDEATLPDKSLTSYLQNIALVTDMDSEDDDNNKVTLMSVHAAKGLEFKSVFVTGMEENLFPSFMSKDSQDGIDEERRLFYVAVTRAEEMLSLSYANSRYQFGQMRFNEPSRFLKEISAHNLDEGAELISNSGARVNMSPPMKKINFQRRSATTTVPKDFVVSPSSAIKEGVSVLHLRFGKGKVKEIQGGAGNKVASVDFGQAGVKRIMLKFAKLQVLEK